jgi:hypothetical protein
MNNPKFKKIAKSRFLRKADEACYGRDEVDPTELEHRLRGGETSGEVYEVDGEKFELNDTVGAEDEDTDDDFIFSEEAE